MASGLLEMIFFIQKSTFAADAGHYLNPIENNFLFRGPDIINIYAARFFTLLCYRWSSKGIGHWKI